MAKVNPHYFFFQDSNKGNLFALLSTKSQFTMSKVKLLLGLLVFLSIFSANPIPWVIVGVIYFLWQVDKALIVQGDSKVLMIISNKGFAKQQFAASDIEGFVIEQIGSDRGRLVINLETSEQVIPVETFCSPDQIEKLSLLVDALNKTLKTKVLPQTEVAKTFTVKPTKTTTLAKPKTSVSLKEAAGVKYKSRRPDSTERVSASVQRGDNSHFKALLVIIIILAIAAILAWL